MNHAPQKIFRIRRDYNSWVANETLEDYALRYTPQSARKWSELRVANTALGGVSFLALEAIGGAIALNYGFSNALWAILVMGLVTFLTGLPIAAAPFAMIKLASTRSRSPLKTMIVLPSPAGDCGICWVTTAPVPFLTRAT